jgi:hypothetical protein
LLLCALARHELVEAASSSARGCVLVQKSEVRLVEALEEVVPGERLQAALAAEPREIDAQDARTPAVARGRDDGWLAAALLCPSADLVVIGGRPSTPILIASACSHMDLRALAKQIACH